MKGKDLDPKELAAIVLKEYEQLSKEEVEVYLKSKKLPEGKTADGTDSLWIAKVEGQGKVALTSAAAYVVFRSLDLADAEFARLN